MELTVQTGPLLRMSHFAAFLPLKANILQVVKLEVCCFVIFPEIFISSSILEMCYNLLRIFLSLYLLPVTYFLNTLSICSVFLDSRFCHYVRHFNIYGTRFNMQTNNGNYAFVFIRMWKSSSVSSSPNVFPLIQFEKIMWSMQIYNSLFYFYSASAILMRQLWNALYSHLWILF